jgi:hypothetical protein
MRNKLFIVSAFLLLVVPLAAQAPPAGGGRVGPTVWVGASVSMFNPDYGCVDNSPFSCGEHLLLGVMPHVDTSSFIFRRIGLEGEARLLLFHGQDFMTQYSFMGGPRVRIFRTKNLLFTGKFLIGSAHFDIAAPLLGTGSYFAYAPGAAIDYRITKYVAARIDYEYQRWPGWACFECGDGGRGGLTPNGFSIGVSYAIHKAGTEINPN